MLHQMKTLDPQRIERFSFCCFGQRATNLPQRLLDEQVMHSIPQLFQLLRLNADIVVQCHLSGRMSGQSLQGFEVWRLSCRIGQVAVTESVRCYAFQIDGLLILFHMLLKLRTLMGDSPPTIKPVLLIGERSSIKRGSSGKSLTPLLVLGNASMFGWFCCGWVTPRRI